MSSMYEPKSQKGFAGNIALWIVGAIIFFGLIGIGIWGFKVLVSPVAGQGGAFQQQQSSTNRVQQQAKFEQIAADYDGFLAQIANAEVALKTASPTTRDQRETELIGLRQICVTAAQNFNAESRKYLARVWKSAGLPATLDPIACQGA